MNTERQPNASMSAFATNPLIAAPSVKPIVMHIIQATRVRFGLYSPTSAVAFGMMDPKPIPAMNRSQRICSMSCANAVATVMTAKNSVAQTRTGRRPILSASMLNMTAPASTPACPHASSGAERRGGDVPFGEHRRRDEAHHLDVEAVHDQRGEAQREHADLQRADPAVVHDLGEVDRSGRGASGLHRAIPLCMPGVVRGAPWTAQGQPTIHGGPRAPHTRNVRPGKKSIGFVVVIGSTSSRASNWNCSTRCTRLRSSSGSLSSEDTTSQNVTRPSAAIVSRSTTLPCSAGILAQRAIVEREDAALVGVEDALDFFAAARRLVAVAAALRRAARFGEAFDGILDLRRRAAAQAAAAGVAAQAPPC